MRVVEYALPPTMLNTNKDKKMNEQDYIDATNLAKARIAQTIIYDILAIADDDVKDRSIALSAITRFVARLENKVAS